MFVPQVPQVIMEINRRSRRPVATAQWNPQLPEKEILMQMAVVLLLGLVVVCALLSQCCWEVKMLEKETLAQGKKK